MLLIFRYTYVGDVNHDGQVSPLDYMNVVANMGRVGATWFDGDVNLDGEVTPADLGLVRDHLGAGSGFGGALTAHRSGPAPVPEPAGLVALFGATVLISRRLRRGQADS